MKKTGSLTKKAKRKVIGNCVGLSLLGASCLLPQGCMGQLFSVKAGGNTRQYNGLESNLNNSAVYADSKGNVIIDKPDNLEVKVSGSDFKKITDPDKKAFLLESYNNDWNSLLATLPCENKEGIGEAEIGRYHLAAGFEILTTKIRDSTYGVIIRRIKPKAYGYSGTGASASGPASGPGPAPSGPTGGHGTGPGGPGVGGR